MHTVDYVKQLESENEELRRRLAESENILSTKLYLIWESISEPVTNNVNCDFTIRHLLKIGSVIVAYIVEITTLSSSKKIFYDMYFITTKKQFQEYQRKDNSYEYECRFDSYPCLFEDLEEAKKTCIDRILKQ